MAPQRPPSDRDDWGRQYRRATQRACTQAALCRFRSASAARFTAAGGGEMGVVCRFATHPGWLCIGAGRCPLSFGDRWSRTRLSAQSAALGTTAYLVRTTLIIAVLKPRPPPAQLELLILLRSISMFAASLHVAPAVCTVGTPS